MGKKTEDTGLGLTEFLAGDNGSAGATTPSPADTSTAKDTQPAPEGDHAAGAGETPPAETVASPEPDAKKGSATAPDTTTASGEKAAGAPVTDGMIAAGQTQKPAAAPITEPDWKAKASQLDKQYRDTRDWATRINQELTESRKQLDILGKKLDGTYDPDKDAEPAPSPERIAREAGLRERVRASNAVAEQMFGQEKVLALFADGGPFGRGGKYENDEAVNQRLLAADLPTVEAIRFLEEQAFFDQYGREPGKIRDTIRQEVKAEIQKDIDKLVDERIKDRLKVKGDSSPTLAEARGTGDQVPAHTGPLKFTPLSQIGNPGLAG